mmetsp:Transcript_7040/g.18865  ORF Transcript_7040/g.18865 Transcript_7040/m.18865 type:complete len:145 (+) Transcript_7040:57-491(+)|eukprot:CAMPEP_0185841608 /NCGR_PEP_ID=MMETSP1353-20130828/17982_1 /TAXON_ID=1077150 /ORGANISM="Erythrolobus australicus, Strain CCMP3124" /LENGTH=144 /DNA_ID=CAMNT_0028541089 /DNA_START=26 /DNA_END=460 /DNA_ORIENTATION=+
MASNINVGEELQETFEKLVHKKTCRAAIGKINAAFTEVELERTMEPVEDSADHPAAWKEMVESLPENDCRYIVYDFKWKISETITKSKVILILWSPEASRVRNKMIYASSQECLLNVMPDVNRQIQATDEDEIDFNAVLKRIEH